MNSRWFSRFPIAGMKVRTSIVFVVSLSLAPGYGTSQTPVQPRSGATETMTDEQKGQGSPAAVLEKAQSALWKKDHDKFRECYRVPPNGHAYFDAVYNGGAAEYEFVGTIEKAYGKEGRARFQDLATVKEGMLFFVPPTVGSPWWNSEVLATIQVNGDEANCYDPIFRRQCKMVRADGVWQISLELPPPRCSAWDVAYYTMFTGFIRTYLSEVGKPGVTIDDIRLRLGTLERQARDKLGPRPKP